MVDLKEGSSSASSTKRMTPFHRSVIFLVALSCVGGIGVLWNTNDVKGVERVSKEAKGSYMASSNSNDDHESSEEDRRPYLIFHPGPSKTATTTIQRDLMSLNDNTTTLMQDGYKYVGHKTRKQQLAAGISNINWEMADKKCLDQMVDARTEFRRAFLDDPKNEHASEPTWPASLEDLPDCWQSVVSELQDHRKTNTSLIFSRESWSNSDREIWQEPGRFGALSAAMRAVARHQGWRIKILVGYRRYAEWILSSVKQGRNTDCVHYSSWADPSECAPTWEWVKAWMERSPPSAKNYHYSYYAQKAWKAQGFDNNVEVVNLHLVDEQGNRRHPTEVFVCDHLPKAETACNYLRNRRPDEISSENVKTLSNGEYHNLVVGATRRGWLPIGDMHDKPRKANGKIRQKISDLPKVVQKLQDLHERTLKGSVWTDFPLDCPPKEELDELLRISLDYERQTVPEFYNDPIQGENAHKASFDKLIAKRSFCSVKVDNVLTGMGSWDEFLRYLNTTAKAAE